MSNYQESKLVLHWTSLKCYVLVIQYAKVVNICKEDLNPYKCTRILARLLVLQWIQMHYASVGDHVYCNTE